MPEIPQSTGPNARRAPLPAPLANPGMASPDAFGASIARGLQHGAEAVHKANDDRDTIEAMDGMNQFLVSDHEKMSEFRSRTGANAKGLTEEAAEDYRKRQDEFEAKISSPGAKKKFRQATDARYAQRNSPILIEHQRDQMRAYEADTLSGSIKNIHLDALNDGSDDAIANADRISAITYQRLADMQGIDPQTRDLALRANAATLYGAAIEQDIEADNWKGAQDRLAKFGDRLDKGTRTTLEAKIREGGLNQQAQDISDTIFKSGYATTKADADRMVSAEKNADLRQLAQTKVDQEWARREAALSAARGATFEGIAKEIEAGGDVDALIAKHPDAAALELADRNHLRNLASDIASNKQPDPGGDRWLDLINEAETSPAAFIKRDLRLERGILPREEWRALADQQARMRGGILKADDKTPIPQGIFSANDIANNAMREFGMNPDAKDSKQDPNVLAFKRQFNRAIIAKGGHTKLTEPDMEKIAAGLLVKHRIANKGAFGREYFTEVPRFLLSGMDRAAFSERDVPADYRGGIVDDLKKAGLSDKEITPELIIEGYNQKLASEGEAKEKAKAKVNYGDPDDMSPFQGGIQQ